MEITYKCNADVERDQLEALYSDVQWTAYTKDMELLMAAVKNSLGTVSAWTGSGLSALCVLWGTD